MRKVVRSRDFATPAVDRLEARALLSVGGWSGTVYPDATLLPFRPAPILVMAPGTEGRFAPTFTARGSERADALQRIEPDGGGFGKGFEVQRIQGHAIELPLKAQADRIVSAVGHLKMAGGPPFDAPFGVAKGSSSPPPPVVISGDRPFFTSSARLAPAPTPGMNLDHLVGGPYGSRLMTSGANDTAGARSALAAFIAAGRGGSSRPAPSSEPAAEEGNAPNDVETVPIGFAAGLAPTAANAAPLRVSATNGPTASASTATPAVGAPPAALLSRAFETLLTTALQTVSEVEPGADLPAEPLPAEADLAAAPGEDAPRDVPSPQGAELITTLIPFDRVSLDPSLSRFLERVEDLVGPVSVPPSPIPPSLLFAGTAAALEALRRWRRSRSAARAPVAWKRSSTALHGLS